MRIDRLHVQNFKGFEDRTFVFPRSIDAAPGGNGSFHLIIGQNGKGKTSALDALAVAVGSWFLGVRGEDSRHIQAGDVRIKINDFGDTQRIEPQFPVVVKAEGVVQGESMSWTRERDGGKTKWIGAKRIKHQAESAVLNMAMGEAVTLPLISYFGTGRLWLEPKDMTTRGEEILSDSVSKLPQETPDAGDDFAERFSSRLAGYRYSIDPRCNPADMLRWLEFEQKLTVQEGGKESRQFQIVKDAICRTVEGCQKVEYHLRLGLLLSIDGQPRLPFRNLSDGQRNIVAMVGDLAFKAAQLNPHLGLDVLSKTPGVVLIDELDLHLHPRWQRHVIEDLRRLFPEVQFIATTHSPFIVQTARDGELLSLDLQPIPETANLGVEEIARGLMGVDRPEVSPRYAQMKEVAKSYLAKLEDAKDAPQEVLAKFEAQLADSIAPYADNPAFQAFLEMERAAALGNRRERPARENLSSHGES